MSSSILKILRGAADAIRKTTAEEDEAAVRRLAEEEEELEREAFKAIDSSIAKKVQQYDDQQAAINVKFNTERQLIEENKFIQMQTKDRILEELAKVEQGISADDEKLTILRTDTDSERRAVEMYREVELSFLRTQRAETQTTLQDGKAQRKEKARQDKLLRVQATEEVLSFIEKFKAFQASKAPMRYVAPTVTDPSSEDEIGDNDTSIGREAVNSTSAAANLRAVNEDVEMGTSEEINISRQDAGMEDTTSFSRFGSQQASEHRTQSKVPEANFGKPSGATSTPLPFMPPQTVYSSDFLNSSGATATLLNKTINFIVSNGFLIAPDSVKGVPIKKITEGDNYWSNRWKTLGSLMMGESAARAEKTVAFFESWEIHPNQLLAKKYYDSEGLCTSNYAEKLRRIFQTLQSAGEADPVRWLRSRLTQLILEKEQASSKTEFDLRKAIQGFSSDPVFKEIDAKYAKLAIKANAKKPVKKVADNPPPQCHEKGKRDQSRAFILPPRRFIKKVRFEGEDLGDDSMIGESEDELAPIHNSTQYAPRAHPSGPRPTAASADNVTTTNTPTLSENISFHIKSFISGTKQWKNSKSAKLEFCVDKTAFEPRDGNPRDSQMNPYHNHPEFIIRPLEISNLIFDKETTVALTKERRKSFGGGIAAQMSIEFRTSHDASVFAAMLVMYNSKMEVPDNDINHLKQKGFLVAGRVPKAILDALCPLE